MSRPRSSRLMVGNPPGIGQRLIPMPPYQAKLAGRRSGLGERRGSLVKRFQPALRRRTRHNASGRAGTLHRMMAVAPRRWGAALWMASPGGSPDLPLFGLLAAGVIRPRIAERIAFRQVADTHRRLEAGWLDSKLVLCPGRSSVSPIGLLRAGRRCHQVSCTRRLQGSRQPACKDPIRPSIRMAS